MAGITNYLGNAIADHVFGKATYTAPTNIYVALFTVTPSDTGGGTEVTGGSYARVSTAAADWNAATSAGLIDNLNAITFTTATGTWGTVVAVGLFDASSGGNLLGWKDGLSQSVTSGITAEFAVGELDVNFNAN